MNKKTTSQLTAGSVGAIVGAVSTYAVMKNQKCDNCDCGKESVYDKEKIKEHKKEYLEHYNSKKCLTDPCETCPHKN